MLHRHVSSLAFDWKSPPGRPRITWMKSVYEIITESHNLTLTEAVNMAQNHPLWRLLAVSGAMHSQWCRPEMMIDDVFSILSIIIKVLWHKSLRKIIDTMWHYHRLCDIIQQLLCYTDNVSTSTVHYTTFTLLVNTEDLLYLPVWCGFLRSVCHDEENSKQDQSN